MLLSHQPIVHGSCEAWSLTDTGQEPLLKFGWGTAQENHSNKHPRKEIWGCGNLTNAGQMKCGLVWWSSVFCLDSRLLAINSVNAWTQFWFCANSPIWCWCNGVKNVSLSTKTLNCIVCPHFSIPLGPPLHMDIRVFGSTTQHLSINQCVPIFARHQVLATKSP